MHRDDGQKRRKTPEYPRPLDELIAYMYRGDYWNDWYRFHPFYLSISPVWGIDAREYFDGPAAHQQGMLGALVVWWPASFWLQWTMAEGTVHTGSPTKPTVSNQTHRGIKKRKMYAIKQIKICAEYRDMLPRPLLDLSGTPGTNQPWPG